MKISILLPYKENFSTEYPGAVSIFVNDITQVSKYKNKITVFGNTTFKNIFKLRYVNIDLTKNIFSSMTKNYIDKYIKYEKKIKSDLIEIHNRPIYLRQLVNNLNNKIYTIFFHNDPLTMVGSKSVEDRKYLLNNCYKIIFNSNWSKKRFLENMGNEFVNSEKLLVVFQSTSSPKKLSLESKKKWITFVGKLNKAKGYDIFGRAILKILEKHKDWSAQIVGDERREELFFSHKRLNKLGFLKHSKVLELFKKSSIAVVCSRWDEPFGRTSLEAAANGCAVIITNKGGLPETITNGVILEKLSAAELEKEINKLITVSSKRKQLQKLSRENFYLTNKYVSGLVDNYRDLKFNINKNFFVKLKKQSLRILHVTNFNERLDGRLFFNTGRRLNNGFIRLGHSVLGFSDRDIQKYYKNIKDFNGSSALNSKLKKTCYNYKPDLIVMGHSDLISGQQLGQLRDDYPSVRIAQWFLDPLNKNGPDYERNKKRILDKSDFVDANFITTSPSVLSFLPKNVKNYFIPNPADTSFETLNNFNNNCNMDVFFALSHGVHRGILKTGKDDDRSFFLNNLIKKTPDVKFDIYGLEKVQPIWADHYFKTISNAKMGLNLSRGAPIKYYSSDRITQIMGNGLVGLIDSRTQYSDFFNKNEMVFYKNLNELSEQIIRISKDEKLRKMIGKNGKLKYMKYFNSTLVSDFIINKTLDIKDDKKYLWNN